MNTISVIHCTAELYKSRIIQLWDECLPGTPQERFDWLVQGNPAGPTEWFLAFTEQGELVGTSSVMPKELFFNGRKIKGGIVGDIMTASAARHQGVAQQIQRKIMGSLSGLAMEFLYVIPNQKSKPLFTDSGVWQPFRLRNYLIPVDYEYFAGKIGGSCLWKWLVHLLTDSSRKDCTDTTTKNLLVADIQGSLDQEVAVLLQSVRDVPEVLLGAKSISYLRWKYCICKPAVYKIIKCREMSGELSGFCIFSVEEEKVHVSEILCLKLVNYRFIMSALITWVRKQRCKGVYLYTVKHNPVLRKIKKFKMFRIGGDMDLFCYGNIFKQTPPWLYFAGDRNL